jgi:hypothetical protein
MPGQARNGDERRTAASGTFARLPCFLLTFGDASRPPVGAVIIEAQSMFQARMTAVARRLAPGVPFGEGLNLTAEMMEAIARRRLAG